MKKLLITLLSLLALTFAVSSRAATATGNFNVNLTLNSTCQINSTASGAATITDLAMTYTSFQTTAATSSTSFNVRCTNTLPYTLALDNASVLDNALDLTYTLSLSAGSGTGTGADQPITVNGAISPGQAGTCTTASCTNSLATNKQRTLTITY